MNQEEQERRGFFRIDDNVALSYRLMATDVSQQDAASGMVDSDASLLVNELEKMREVSRIHFRHVEKEQPEVARYLAHIDSKIDLIAQHVMMESDGLFVKRTQEVNISGSGLAFTVKDDLPVGRSIELKFVLKPSLASIQTYSKIISCEPHAEQFRVAVEFTHLNDDDRDLLIRHVVKKQMNDIREHKTLS